MYVRTLIAMVATAVASFAAATPTIVQAAEEKPAMQSSTPKPSKSDHIAVNGIDYYYAIYGKGEPLLLIHGGLGQIEMFGPNLATLAQSRRYARRRGIRGGPAVRQRSRAPRPRPQVRYARARPRRGRVRTRLTERAAWR